MIGNNSKPKSFEPIGIILCGGRSSRMGEDKSLLLVDGKPLYKIIYDLLSEHCLRVYISCRIDQVQNYNGLPVIIDEPDNHGPMSGLVAAIRADNTSSIITIPCDMPDPDMKLISQMIQLNRENLDGVFIKDKTGMIEPLFGVYNPSLFPSIISTYDSGNYSLRKFLQGKPNLCFVTFDSEPITNINTPADMENYILKLNLNK